jgi:hypothetical protein
VLGFHYNECHKKNKVLTKVLKTGIPPRHFTLDTAHKHNLVRSEVLITVQIRFKYSGT